MDIVTQSLLAVALARLLFRTRASYTTLAIIVAANLADLDLLYSWPGIRYLEYHRGLLDSLLFIPVWAVLVAWGWRWVTQKRGKTQPSWLLGLAVGAVGAASHVLLDWTTMYGARLFAPFSQHWYALDWMPYFDPFVWLLLASFLGFPMLLGLIVNEVSSVQRRRNPHRMSAALALVLFAGWMGLRARQHAAALDLLNSPNLQGWYNGQIPYDWGAYPVRSSPYEWNAVVDLPNNIVVAEVSAPWNESFGMARVERNYIRPPRLPAMAIAEGTSTGRAFLQYARFPMTDEEDDPDGSSKVFISDMRFATGIERPYMRAEIDLDGSQQVVRESFRY